MIRKIQIENYKSIQKLQMELGRITILIGENGCGKTNLLESIALASAASNYKLDNEFLASRGIRVTEPQLMRSAFDKENITQQIKIHFEGNDKDKNDITANFVLQNDNEPYSKWINKSRFSPDVILKLSENLKENPPEDDKFSELYEIFKNYPPQLISEAFNKISESLHLKEFLIYSPENLSLRIFAREGQIQPLGINGEGLFKLLKFLSLEENKEKLNELKEKLQLIDWFKDFKIPKNSFENEKYIQIGDRYLDEDLTYFDQKSSNEGFLFLLFYFSLFISDITPKFFAIDNIDASLNPKLCDKLIRELVISAKKHNKQAIFTTHNPAVLDGLNLDDDEQRLFVIYRNKLGHTKAKRVHKPKTPEGQEPVKLSEAFLRGYIGGLPKGF